MSISEDDVRPFAQRFHQAIFEDLMKQAEQMAKVAANMFKDVPRDADGRIEDDYFRGTEDTLEGFVKGLRDGFNMQLARFNDVFEYQWYRYQKDKS